MARIRIVFPDQVLFETQIPVRITDLNYGNHVGNDVYLRYLQEVRAEWVKSAGYASETAIEGGGLIMADAAVSYRAEVFYGQTLKAELAADEISRSTFDLVYCLTDVETEQVVLLAKTGMVFFDYENRTIIPIPPKFLMKLHG